MYKEVCEQCKSTNTWRDWIYPIGTFVLTYKIKCKDCGYISGEKRVTG